jgi:uncharacterized protein
MKQSPSSESSLAVVQAMYAAFSAGDEPRLRELIASDVEWQQCEGFPGGEHRSGIESVLAGVLRGNKATWQGFAVAIDEYVCDRDVVVAIGSYSGTHSLTGKSMRSVFTHVYDVVDGRIRRFRQFADTWPMVAAMQGGR